MQDPTNQIRSILDHIGDFTAAFGHILLRPYQIEAAEAVIQSILDNDGETFVWKFSRQGGKDETLAALYQYIMTILSHRDTSIVAACPTFLPQTRLSIDRLSDRLSRHLALQRSWKRQAGHIFRIHRARTLFLSAQSHANVVGATAWPLLVMNEAQDISPAVYDKRFAPMAAANNATRLFCGTAWTRDTLLAREERLCRLKDERDGKRRVFVVDGEQIAKVHPPYGKFLESEIARLGPNHPIVVSQYLCREIDSQVGMFTPARLALMQGGFQPPLHTSAPRGAEAIFPSDLSDAASPIFMQGGIQPPLHTSALRGAEAMGEGGRSTDGGVLRPTLNAFLIDVAGMDETSHSLTDLDSFAESGRDSTTLSVAEIDLSTLPTLQAPTYRIVYRMAWQGQNHLTVFGQLKALAETWRPQHIVIDATGVGEGLWAMLDKAFRTRVIPVKFTQQEKSEIGWRFLSIIETGRFRSGEGASGDHRPLPPQEGWKKLDETVRMQSGEGASSDHRPLPPQEGWKKLDDIVRMQSGEGASSDHRPLLPQEGWKKLDETVRIQYSLCQSEILPGPAKTLRWGVPDGTRGPDGELVHDDHVIADSLVAKLDELEWHISSPTLMIRAKDPLDEMSRFK